VNTNNPNATFSYINTNILQPKCVSCHNQNNQAGNVNLSSYSSVLNQVKVNSAATSPLYISVAPGGNMPQGGSPLSAGLVQDISDWINSGAKNN
jgi:hypothetical protein